MSFLGAALGAGSLDSFHTNRVRRKARGRRTRVRKRRSGGEGTAASPAVSVTQGHFALGVFPTSPGKAPGTVSVSVFGAFVSSEEKKGQINACPSTGAKLSPVLGRCSG